MPVTRIPHDDDHAARVALYYRLGRPGGVPPWPRWALASAVVDLEVYGTPRMLNRAAMAALAAYTRLGVRIDL